MNLILLTGGATLLVIFAGLVLTREGDNYTTKTNDVSATIPTRFQDSDLKVDFAKSSIDLEQLLSGGPGKDVIPALTNPKFVAVSEADTADETMSIVVERNGKTKIYPYNILVWHEVVNDSVGGEPVLVTFCPLCGSAIVFDPVIDGETVDFGVSGLLYESNLVMYDRRGNESLWSQSLGRAIVGENLGSTLEHVPFELMTFDNAREAYSGAVVLSKDTGYSRDYTTNPYSGYEDREETLFPVSVADNRFPGKEVFYIVPLEGMSVAVRINKDNGIYRVPETTVDVEFDNGSITARWGDVELPGYYEMWFSWATHHHENGIVLK